MDRGGEHVAADVVAIMAGLIPARRASRIDPISRCATSSDPGGAIPGTRESGKTR